MNRNVDERGQIADCRAKWRSIDVCILLVGELLQVCTVNKELFLCLMNAFCLETMETSSPALKRSIWIHILRRLRSIRSMLMR